MAENRLYDFSWALSDRRAAGYPVSDASFLEHTPAAAHVMALTPWVGFWEKDIYSRCRAGGDVPADAALPDFSLCDFR